VYTLKPPFVSKAHSYGKGLIINHGHYGIFGQWKPDAMSDDVWKIVQMCWAMDPPRRPLMEEVNGMLVRMREDK
jgi:hypothetical protein